MHPKVESADRAARDAVKRLLHRYGEITSGVRTLPDFAIIGAKRGGTTSLYRYLLEHPSIAPMFPGREHIKGVHYFDSEFARGPRWYRSHFPIVVAGHHLARPRVTSVISGEASPYYLFHPLAAGRAAREAPDLRLIVLLRDPVERAYSHYKERVLHGGESFGFEDALDAEADRLRGEAERIVAQPGYRSVAHEDHSYVAQGRYLDMLPRWFELFPREQFHIVASEDFYRDPNRIVNEVWTFLGLAPTTLQSRTRHNYNPSPDIRPATRLRLQEAFADHNRELEKLLARSLPWAATAPGHGSATGGGGDLGAGEPVAVAAGLNEHADAVSTRTRPLVTPWPAVTVVVPTRDRPALLERAVQSILRQSYPGDVECVVVFDQSEPASVAVPASAGRRLSLVTNTRRPGLAGARNSGFLLADTPLVAICDDDDEWDPDKLRLQVERLVCSSAEFVACGVRVHYGDRVIARVPPPSVALPQLVRDRVAALHPSTFVIRREALLEGIGLVDEQIPGSYGEDYDWLLRAARRQPIVAVEQTLADVYWHEQSFFAERWQTIADALVYLLDKHPELAADRRGLARIQGQIAFARAARGCRQAALRTGFMALRNNPLERRGYLALAVAAGAVPAASVVHLANRHGRGI
jgi:Glycosyl transferase family 2/Sulfotransferase domain